MTSTFFKTLVFLEETLIQDAEKKSRKMALPVLNRLIAFVESGVVVDSEIEKFILKNFRLTSTEITKKWNEINYDRVKSKDTIRGQVSVLNRYFSSLFDITADALNEAFVTDNADVLMRLSDILTAFDIGDFNIAERFPILQRYLPDDSTASVYTVEECAKEVNFLKTLDKSIIEGMLAELDKDKLIYVLQSIREPLLTNYYKKSEDTTSKQKLCCINQRKVEFYKAFSVVKPKQLRPVDNIEAPKREESGVEPDVAELPPEEAVVLEETPEGTQSALLLPVELETILNNGLNRYQSLSMEQKLAIVNKSTAESKQRCKEFFKLFSEDGFKDYLNSLNIYDILCELKHYTNFGEGVVKNADE